MKKIISLITNFLVRLIGKKRIVHYTFTDDETRAYNMQFYGYLDEIGWWNSFRAQKPVDINNKAIPWTTYSFIDFISGRLSKDFTMLEYGSGNSSRYFSERVKEIYSIEDNKEWFEIVKKNNPANAHVILAEEGMIQYTQCISTLGKTFDIIFVDGSYRNECIRYAMSYLTPSGVIVLDDTNFNHNGKDDYQESFDFLKENGFKRIDFWGISPSLFYRKSTSVFYKPDNCLNI